MDLTPRRFVRLKGREDFEFAVRVDTIKEIGMGVTRGGERVVFVRCEGDTPEEPGFEVHEPFEDVLERVNAALADPFSFIRVKNG